MDKIEHKLSKLDQLQLAHGKTLDAAARRQIKLDKIRDRLIDLLDETLKILECATKGHLYNGTEVTKGQVYIALPIVQKFAPLLDKVDQQQASIMQIQLAIPRPVIDQDTRDKIKELDH